MLETQNNNTIRIVLMKNRNLHPRTDTSGKSKKAGLPRRTDLRTRIPRDHLTTPTLRLANQIREILNVAIPNSGHPLLSSFTAGNIEHHGIGPHFIVQLYSVDRTFKYDPVEIKAALDEISLKLRFEVAKIAARKNTPDFVFDVLPPGVQPG
jgi:hypothetical protein